MATHPEFLLAIIGLAFASAASAGPQEQAPGARFRFSPVELAKPAPSEAVANPPGIVPRPKGARLRGPEGFVITLFAAGIAPPRALLVLPNGDVLAAQPGAGRIALLRDRDGDGKADRIESFASGFELPFGLAYHDGAVYVGDVHAIWKLAYTPGALHADTRERVTGPGALGNWDFHNTRNIAFGPKGELFLAEGSMDNVGEDLLPHAAVSRVLPDGTLEAFATGLRNPVGLAFRPGTDDLYVTVNERDMLGNNLVPDYFTRVGKGDFLVV